MSRGIRAFLGDSVLWRCDRCHQMVIQIHPEHEQICSCCRLPMIKVGKAKDKLFPMKGGEKK
jgi:hypothetical protein